MTVHSIDGAEWKTKLEHIENLAKADKGIVFNNLGHLITEESLKDTYRRMDGSKAPGTDKITKEKYGEKLESNIIKLLERIRRESYHPKAAR